MQTEWSSKQFEFEGLEKRKVVAAFDGGTITSDAGVVLLREADRALGISVQAAACFSDGRNQELIVHDLETLLAQRIHAIALGYEDVNDHDDLRHDPALALLADRLEPKRADCAALAGKSTLNQLVTEAGIAPSVGSIGDSYDNALAQSTIGLFKTEVINFLGPWKTKAQLEWETLKWVSWYNTKRLHSAIGYITPQEAEEAFYANMNSFDKVT